MTQQNSSDGWKLDKHIPIAVIVAIMAQGIGGIWWATGLGHSIQDHERRLSIQESAKIAERMAVVEIQMRDSRELQLEMSRKLDRLIHLKDPRGLSQ